MKKQNIDGRPCIMGCGLEGREDDGFCSDACRSLYYREKDEALNKILKDKQALDEMVKMVMGG